jgi:hypothetical protein
MDHDQRFKTLLREFFADFLRLFFADWAARLDLSAVEWLDKEVFPEPPEGTRHALDLVAKVSFLAGVAPGPMPALLLVHIEIEAPDRTTALKPRLPYYYHFLRDHYQLSVLPVVLYLQVGLDGIGTDDVVESVLEFEVNRFRYLYVGLPGLDGVQYLQGDNWLGVALSALMRISPERVAWLGAEALRRLREAPLTEQQRFLLADCVEAYLPLDEGQKQELQHLKTTKTYEGVREMNETSYEKGRRVERLEVVCIWLEKKFGPVPQDLRTHLEGLSMDKLQRWIEQIPTATSLAELGWPANGQPA